MSEFKLTVGDLLEEGQLLFEKRKVYFGHGTDNAWDEAVYLLSHVLQLPPDADRGVTQRAVSDAEAEAVRALYQRRVDERIPAPYLTGTAWFCGLPFQVDQRVIIPRSPIAELIQNYFQPWLETEPKTVLDLCCGSGCIGIACAYAFEDAQVIVSDISADALAVAQQNIDMHQLAGRVIALQSDLFDQLGEQRFDLIVSNPPYVDAEDFASMPDEYQHEPELALTSGDDGLDFTRRLLREAEGWLNDGGLLVVEVGNSSLALDAAFPSVPFLWLEFSEGDAGVFLLSKRQLQEHRESFQ